jgi:selenocysteine-specific elongation factor
VPIGGLVFDTARLDALAIRAVEAVEAEHRDHPLRPGLPLATLAERLEVGPEVVEELVRRTSSLQRSGPDISITGRVPGLTPDDEATWQRAAERLGTSLAVPPESGLGLDGEVISLKLRTGELVRVAAGIVYLPSQIDELKSIITSLDGEFTVAEFRDAAGLSRKYAVPILEWSDKEGLTVRRGDTRRVR